MSICFCVYLECFCGLIAATACLLCLPLRFYLTRELIELLHAFSYDVYAIYAYIYQYDCICTLFAFYYLVMRFQEPVI